MNTAYQSESRNLKTRIVHDTQPVDPGAPLRWLRRGVDDFASAPLTSISYGLIFSLLALAASVAAAQLPQLTLTFVAGLLIVGPFLATGLYQIAKLRGQRSDLSLADHVRVLKRQKGRVAIFVLVMLLLAVAWIRASSLLVAVYYGQLPADIGVVAGSLGDTGALTYLAPLIVTGVLFALLMFAAGAVSLPMVVDDKAEMIPALVTSVKTVVKQPGTMLLWAGMVTGLTLLGVATFFVGLVFMFPVLGYAAWHSYQEMVKE